MFVGFSLRIWTQTDASASRGAARHTSSAGQGRSYPSDNDGSAELRTRKVSWPAPFAALRLRTHAAKRYHRVEGATVMIWKLRMVGEQSSSQLRLLLAPLGGGREMSQDHLVHFSQGNSGPASAQRWRRWIVDDEGTLWNMVGVGVGGVLYRNATEPQTRKRDFDSPQCSHLNFIMEVVLAESHREEPVFSLGEAHRPLRRRGIADAA